MEHTYITRTDWDCPKCDHEDSVTHSFETALEPLAKQINEHMKEAHNITDEETLSDLQDEIWQFSARNTQLTGRIEPIY